MALALVDLVSRLQAAVPAQNDVPSMNDYRQHVQDAVWQLSQDAPLRRRADLAVVAGTASYALPADFLFVIDLALMPGSLHDGVLVGADGLVPVGDAWQERHEVVGGMITFYPTPAYTATRTLRYAAYHRLTGAAGSEEYATLSENGGRVALLYAQYLALTQQGSAVAAQGWRYQIGDEMVDKSNQGKNLMGQAQRLLDEYRRAVQAQKGYGAYAQ